MDSRIVDKHALQDIKEFLRKQNVLFRFTNSSVLVPEYDESFHLSSVCKDGRIPGYEAHRALMQSPIKDGVPYKWTASEMQWLKIKPPMYCRRVVPFGYLAQIDIRSSYFTFYRALSWSGRWPTKRMKYHIGNSLDSLADWKAARNAVVGIAISTTEKWDKGGKISVLPKYNKWLSPYLWRCLMSLHRHIAWIMLDQFDAAYINTDGFVFSDPHDFEAARNWFIRHGLEYSSMEGYGLISGWQQYNIGSYSIAGGTTGKLLEPNFSSKDVNHKLFTYAVERIKSL